MVNRFLTVLFLMLTLAFTTASYGQTVKIYGNVFSPEQEGIVGVSVMLLGAQDSIMKTYAVTDKEGNFELNKVKAGDYFLKMSFLGYLPYEQGIVVKENSTDINLGQVQLKPKLLDEVVIQGQYIPIQFKGDSVVYDPKAFEIKNHDLIEDLLKQLPGVEVQTDGTILFQGKKVDQVLIDGEEFFSNDPKIASKNLSAKSVEKIQIFDKKSDLSNFTGIDDDAEESLTINLKLKEEYKKGYFGSILVATGLDYPISDPARHKIKGNFNYFRDNWGFSVLGMTNNINETSFSLGDNSNLIGDINNYSGTGNSSAGLMSNQGTGFHFKFNPSSKTSFNSSYFIKQNTNMFNRSVERETYFIDSVLYTTENQIQNSGLYDHNFNLYLRQVLDSSHFISLSGYLQWSNSGNDNGNTIENFDQNNTIASRFITDFKEDIHHLNGTVDLNYRKKFDKTGRNTGVSLGYRRSENDNETNLNYINSLLLEGVLTDFFTDQAQTTSLNSTFVSAKWVWAEPINENHSMQFGLTQTVNVDDRNKTVLDSIGGLAILNDTLSAFGDYQQLNSAFEINYKFEYKELKTSIGGNYEHLKLSGNQIFEQPKQYDFILPKITIKWKKNLKTKVRLSYRTNYNAPSLNQLQPLPNNTNPSQIVFGNPDLIPEFSHNIRLSYRTYDSNNLSFFMLSLSGNLVNDNIVNSQKINANYVKEIKPENTGSERSLNLNLNYGAPIEPLHLKLNFSNSARVSNGIVNLNDTQDNYTSYNFTPSLSIENITKTAFDLKSGLTYNYAINEYKTNQSFNNTFSSLRYYGTATIKIKDRLVVNFSGNHTLFSGLNTSNQILLLNFHMGLNLTSSRKLQVYVSLKDLLNQNKGINQNYQQNVFEQSSTQALGRYGMIGLKWAFIK